MKSYNEWPKFETLLAPQCWTGCGRLNINTIEISGYARGHGEFKGRCPKCHSTTWFDIKENPRHFSAEREQDFADDDSFVDYVDKLEEREREQDRLDDVEPGAEGS